MMVNGDDDDACRIGCDNGGHPWQRILLKKDALELCEGANTAEAEADFFFLAKFVSLCQHVKFDIICCMLDRRFSVSRQPVLYVNSNLIYPFKKL